MKSLSKKIVLILGLIVPILGTSGCASLKEVADENPLLVYLGVSNIVSQRIKVASDPEAKAGFYMALVSRLRAGGDGKIPYAGIGEFIRNKVGYGDMHPADRKAVDDLLMISKLVIEKELKKKGFDSIPTDYSLDLTAYLDAIEAGARVYLPN